MLSNYLVDKMVESDVIQKEDKELYLYGLNQGFIIAQNIFITIIIGFFGGNLIATCVFLIIYIPLRSFSGGYHAATQKRCFVYSIFLIVIIQLYFCFLFKVMYQWTYPTVLICSFIIYFYSPMQSSNKPLSLNEKNYYKKVVSRILITACILIFILKILSCLEVEKGIVVAVFIQTLLLYVERFRSRCLQKSIC